MKINSLLAGTFALVLVTGMTGSAFAGGGPFDCTITQGDMLSVQLPAGQEVTIQKQIECNEEIDGFSIGISDCEAIGVIIDTANPQFPPQGIVIDEIFEDTSLNGEEGHCTQSWEIISTAGAVSIEVQELWFNEPTVGGEFLSIDSTALLLSSAQSFSWMIPLILSGIGIGLFVVSRKSENS